MTKFNYIHLSTIVLNCYKDYLHFIFTLKTTVYDGGNVLSAKPVKY